MSPMSIDRNGTGNRCANRCKQWFRFLHVCDISERDVHFPSHRCKAAIFFFTSTCGNRCSDANIHVEVRRTMRTPVYYLCHQNSPAHRIIVERSAKSITRIFHYGDTHHQRRFTEGNTFVSSFIFSSNSNNISDVLVRIILILLQLINIRSFLRFILTASKMWVRFPPTSPSLFYTVRFQ